MKFLLPVGGVTDGYGIITAPNHKGIPAGIKAGLPWAADLGCLQGPDFVKKANFDDVFMMREITNKDGAIRIEPSWIERMKPYKDKCLFISGFDIVGDAVATLEAYEEFSRYFISGGWPFAYVAQNGAENLPIPVDCTAVFIGGVVMDGRFYRKSKSPNGKLHPLDWKESMEAVSVIKRAQAMGKHIHIGRVNWQRKYNLFNCLAGSENFTCDGTRTRKDGTEKTIRAWNNYMDQPPLFTI